MIFSRIVATTFLALSLCQLCHAKECKVDPVNNLPIYFEGRPSSFSAEFIPVPGGYNQIVTRTSVATPDIWSEYQSTVKSNIPNNDCGFSAELRGVSLNQARNGELEGVATIRTRMNLCVKTKVLKIYDVYKTKWESTTVFSSEDLAFRKTIEAKTRFRGQLIDPAILSFSHNPDLLLPSSEKAKIDVSTSFDGYSDFEKFFINLIKFANGLTKLASLELISFDDMLSMIEPSIPDFTPRDFPQVSELNFHPRYESVDLRKVNDEYFVDVISADRDPKKCSTSRALRVVFLSRAINSRKEHFGQRTHQVQSEDSLWKIVKDEYGSGYHHLNIARYNKLRDPNLLRIGSPIELPTLSQLSGYANTIVLHGQSLWEISADNPELYRGFVSKFEAEGRDPDFVYENEIVEFSQ